MVYAISCLDLLFQHKKASTIGRSWHDKAKKICNTAIVPSQICDGTVGRLCKSIHSWHDICHILPRFTISAQKNINNWL